MYYTVISKSGWQGATWTVQDTFKSRVEAERHKANIYQRRDPKQAHFNVQIKAHHKKLSELLTKDDLIKFSDGTTAVWDDE